MKVVVMGEPSGVVLTGVSLATRGHEVHCVEQDSRAVCWLAAGHCPFDALGTETLLQAQIRRGKITFSETVPTVPRFEVAMIVLDLFRGEAKKDDVLDITKQLARTLEEGTLVVLLGRRTNEIDICVEQLFAKLGRHDLKVAAIGITLREDTAMEDALYPTNLFIQVPDKTAQDFLAQLYDGFDTTMNFLPRVSKPISDTLVYN